jgi:putative holliday junction resolvase
LAAESEVDGTAWAIGQADAVGGGEPFDDFPRTGRLAGLDFGTVRMGVATCDPTQNWVTPYDTYTRRNAKLDAKFLNELAQSEHIVGWVVGLPIHCDGNESQKSGEVRKFAAWLEELTGLPVALFDERFSTAEARRLLRDTGLSPQKRKQNLDRLAAHLILSHFVEARRTNQNPSIELE